MSVLTRFALRFRTVVLLVVGLVIAAGSLAVAELDQELFPPIEPPYLVVTAGLSGASPMQVADDLADPIETAVMHDSNAEWVQSQSDEGFALIFAEYTYGTDVDEARRDLLDELAEADLPDGVSGPEAQSVSPNDLPIYSVAVTGGDSAVRDFVNDELVTELDSVNGVADILQAGADPLTVTIDLDPDALHEHGLTIGEVVSALDSAGTSAPVGAISDGETETPVRVLGSVDEVEEVLVPLPAGPGQSPPPAEAPEETPDDADVEADGGGDHVRVGDLGEVDTAAPRDSGMISRHNGEDSAVIEVVKDQDANTVRVVDELEAAIDDLDVPDGIRIETVTNQATEISDGVSDVTRDALLGALLALAVIIVFLRSGRGTVVAGVAIPLSLIAALAMMNGAGVGVNILTLGALAVAAGRVIDDSIVVLENVTRHLEAGKPRMEAVREGTREVAGAVTTASFSTMMVFLPLSLVAGIAREAFAGFALTVVFALIASLLISLTVVPVLGSALLRAGDGNTEGSETSGLRRGMRSVIGWALGHRILVIAITLVAFAGSVLSATTLPLNLFPSADAEYVDVAIDLPTDLTVEEVADRIDGFESDVDGLSGVESYTTQIGADTEDGGLAAIISNGGSASVTIELDPSGHDDHDAFVAEVVDDLDISMGRHDLDGTIAEREFVPIPTELMLQITGDDFDEVVEAGEEVLDALEDLDELDNVEWNLADSREELVVELDAAALADTGMDTDTVVQLLRLGIHGPVSTTIDVDGDERDVAVRFDREVLTNADELTALGLAPGISVGDIGDVVASDSPTMISRYDRERSVEITATILDEDMSAVGQLVNDEIEDLDLSDDVAVVDTGANEEIDQVFADMGTAMMIAVAFTYLILVGSFGSLLIPLIVLLALPFAAIGALPALAATGRPLGLPALIGLLMLIGIVVTNAIVLLKFVQQLRAEGYPIQEALIEATQVRVRPVLMTALTTIFALTPLALGLSGGALLSAPLATVVIGGLVTSTVLTLVVIPVVYSLVSPPMRNESDDAAAAPEAAQAATAGPTGAAVTGDAGATHDAAPDVTAVAVAEPAAEAVVVGRLATADEAERLRMHLVMSGFDAERMGVRYVAGAGEQDAPRPGLPGLDEPAGLRTYGAGYGVEVSSAIAGAVRAILQAPPQG